MSDPGLVIGHMTLNSSMLVPEELGGIAKKIITELNGALDGDDEWFYDAKNWEYRAVSYTTSLHASARAFRDIVVKHRKHIKEFSLAIYALEEPYEELFFTDKRFVVNNVQR